MVQLEPVTETIVQLDQSYKSFEIVLAVFQNDYKPGKIVLCFEDSEIERNVFYNIFVAVITI